MTAVAATDAAETTSRGRRGSAEETRLQIIAAMVELLDEFAIWEISITMLTRRVGVSSQLFYRHFASLDDVLAAHWEQILSEVPDLEPLLGGEWPVDEGFKRLRRVSEANLTFWNRHRTAMRVLGMLDDLRKPRFAKFRELRGRGMAQVFSDLARRQQALGRLPISLPDQQVAWELTSRLQQFGLSYPQIVAQGMTGDHALCSHAAMLAISLGFEVPDHNLQDHGQ